MRKTSSTKKMVQCWIEEHDHMLLTVMTAEMKEKFGVPLTMADTVRKAIRDLLNNGWGAGVNPKTLAVATDNETGEE